LITDRLGLSVPGNPGATELNPRAQQNSVAGVEARSNPKEFDGLMKSMSSEKNRKPSGSTEMAKGRQTEDNPDTVREDKKEIGGKPEQREDKPESRKAEEVGQAVQARSKGEPLTAKQKAMLKFMDSMESELGVPPTRIVEAMAKLDLEQMRQNPMESAPQVIENLSLDDQDQDKAVLLYAGMLADLNMIKPQQNPVPTSESYLNPAAAGAYQFNPDMMPASQRRAIMNQSIDRMNQQFFMNQKPVGENQQQMGQAPSDAALAANLGSQEALLQASTTGTEIPAELAMQQQVPTDYVKPVNSGQEIGAQSLALQSQPLKTELAADNINAQASREQDSGYAELGVKLAALGAAAKALGGEPPVTKAANVNANVALDMQALATMMKNPHLMGQGAGSGTNSDGGFDSKDDDWQSGDVKTSGQLATSPADMFKLNSAETAPTKASAAATANAAPVVPMAIGAGGNAQANPNIQNIMNQAQYIMRKGGGEAVVKMNPEGLGEVQMKIQVNQGRVNVEMSTETKEAKQIIENSMSDLKNSLSTHKLTVDSVKVDVGNQTSSDSNQQQKAQDFSQNQGREQARQFMSQFRDENLSGRQQFLDLPGVRAYQKTDGPEPLAPQPLDRARMQRYTGMSKGNGLNLVA
jgi:flagellar hook-length control protein FliK